MLNHPRVVVQLPSRPSYGRVALLLHEQPNQQHQQPPPSLRPFVLDSCFGSDFDHQMTKSFVVFCYGANGFGPGSGSGFDFWPGDRCIPDHHRTLLKQVHSLYFHACYGYVR
jgi:hypothetical protein